MHKVLLIDAGNTRIKWAIVEAGLFADHGLHMVESGDLLTEKAMSKKGLVDFASRLSELSDLYGVTQLLVSNVLGSSWLQELKEALFPYSFICPVVGCSNILLTKYENPLQLGLDRWLACLAVAHQAQTPLNLVASFGTATTIDAVVSASLVNLPYFRQVHLGGTITPGVQMMLASLNQFTRQLPLAKAARYDWPTSTERAIGEGVLVSQAATLEFKWRELESHFPEQKITIWLSGGYADQIQLPRSDVVVRTNDLVFKGLICSYLEGEI
jgi:type III pantothenate kinase